MIDLRLSVVGLFAIAVVSFAGPSAEAQEAGSAAAGSAEGGTIVIAAAETESETDAAPAPVFVDGFSAAPYQPVTITDEGRALGDIIKGDPNAPVTIIEYASLTCPHCASFHVQSFPTIDEEYVKTGKVKFIVREVYFDQFGLLAAAVARCGGAERYHQFIDVFLKQQREWSSGDAATIRDQIRRIGLLGGLPPQRVDACMTDRDYHVSLVETYQETSSADGVRSTPYFLVNGQPVRGAVGPDEMSAVIESLL